MHGIFALTRRAVVLAAVTGLGVSGFTLATAGAAVTATSASAAPAAPAARSAPAQDARSASALPSDVTRLCPAATAGQFECMALVRNDVTPNPASPAGGYGPSQLQSAYNLAAAAANDGNGATVAVVDAYYDPNATSDFNTYRAQYGLPICDPAVSEAGCLTYVTETGASPQVNTAWAAQQSMDVDMIAAICPNCHVILAEAQSTAEIDMEETATRALTAGATFETLGWGGPERATDANQGLRFENAVQRVAITAAAGDDGYGVQYPASSQFVTAVGGTTLTADSSSSRGWSESVWTGTGAGCSTAQWKPSWQADAGCANRTQNDVAAVADPEHGVAFYDSYEFGGWGEGGGTNVSSAIIAAIYALAGTPERDTLAASYPYRDPSALYPVTTGSDGTCPQAYLCTAGAGYSGPAGLGTPDGIGGFTPPSGNVVTLFRTSGSPVISVGATSAAGFMVAIDTGTAPGLTASVTGQPPGMTVSSCPAALQGCGIHLEGPATQAGGFTARVTVTDSTGASASVSIPVTVDDVIPNFGAPPQSATIGTPVSLPVTVTSESGEPLNFTATGLPPGLSFTQTGPDQITFTGTPTTAGSYLTTITATNPVGGSGTGWIEWSVHGTITLKSPGNITSTVGGSGAVIMRATDSVKGTQLFYSAAGLPPGLNLEPFPGNVVSGWLSKPGTYHVTLTVTDSYQARTDVTFTWTVRDSAATEAYGPIRLDLGGKCLDDGSGVRIWQCNGTGSQAWTLAQDGTIRGRGQCLTESGKTFLSRVVLASCTGATSQQWQLQDKSGDNPSGWAGPALANVASGLCLGDPGGNRNGVYVEVMACNLGANKIWTTPAGPIEDGIPGMCLADPGNATANGTRIVLWQCNGWHEEQFSFQPDGTVQIHGKCLYVYPLNMNNGAAVRLESCDANNTGEQWAFYGPNPFGGTIYNPWNGNDLGTGGSAAVNGTPVGTYIGGLQLSVTWRPL